MILIESQSPPPIIVPLQEGAGGFMDWSPEEHASRPRSSRPGRQISREVPNREHSSSLHEQRGKGRPRYRSSPAGDFNGQDHLAVDVGFEETSPTLESSSVVFNDEAPIQEALDGVLPLKERKRFERTVGLNGNNGEVNRGDLKAIAQLNQHALERIGFGGLGRDLRDAHLLEEARNAAKELVSSISTLSDSDAGQIAEAVSRILDGMKVTQPDARQWVGTGAALAGFALLKKRGKQGLAYLVLTSGLAFCGGGSTANNPEGAEALGSFVQTDTFGIQGTFLDNASVTAPDFGKLYGVKTDVAPNYTTLTTTLLDKLKSDYPALSPTTLSYVNLNNGQNGRALEFAIVGTNQTATTGEPLFVAAYLDGGNVRINTVVRKIGDRYGVTYSDGSTREEKVTSYRLVEAINDKGELVLGDPLEVIIEHPEGPFVIVLDPAGDGDAFIFVPAAGQDQTVLIGGAGHFGPHLAALKPVAGIPPTEAAPLELLATATVGPTEQLASATPIPSETPEPSATPDSLSEIIDVNYIRTGNSVWKPGFNAETVASSDGADYANIIGFLVSDVISEEGADDITRYYIKFGVPKDIQGFQPSEQINLRDMEIYRVYIGANIQHPLNKVATYFIRNHSGSSIDNMMPVDIDWLISIIGRSKGEQVMLQIMLMRDFDKYQSVFPQVVTQQPAQLDAAMVSVDNFAGARATIDGLKEDKPIASDATLVLAQIWISK